MRRAFTLLEVMVALAILVTSLAILAETQASAVRATREAERIVTATELAEDKLHEVMLRMEEEGFTDMDVTDQGDFTEFGDDVMDLEFGDALEDYHYEYTVYEIDIALAGDIAGMAQEYVGNEDAPGGGQGGDAMGAGGMPGMGMLGGMLSPEMMSDYVGRYIRQVYVRVWWGDSEDEAEERGDMVEIVGHVINPEGRVIESGGDPNAENLPGMQGGGNFGGGGNRGGGRGGR